MEIKIISFGKIAAITGGELLVRDVADTDSLRTVLEANYPELQSTKYVVAVQKNIIRENTILQQGTEVALLPPFSGG